MTSGPTSLGGLYVTVNLDVSGALNQLRRLETQFRRTLQSSTTSATGGGVGAAAKNMDALADATKRLGSSTNGLSTFRKELATTAAILAPGRAGTAVYGANALGRSFAALGTAGIGGAAAAGIGAVTVAALGMATAFGVAAAGLTKMTVTGITAGRELERLLVSMESLLGSKSLARGEVEWLVELAKVSPFLTDTIVAMDKFLISQGVVSGALRGGLIKAVNDMGSALGLTDDQLGSITYALAQVQARGYLSGDELRQLANQFIPVWNALATTGEFAGMTRQELRKLVEEGGVSATQFFEALIGYAERFEGASAAMALTLDGLIAKFKDIAQYQIGLAFLDVEGQAIGPIETLRNVMASLVSVLEQIDFRPIGAAIGNFMDIFLGPLAQNIRASGEGIVNFFEVILPRAIAIVGAVVRPFVEAGKQLFAVFREVALGFKDGMVVIGTVFAIGFASAISSINALIGALGILASMFRFTMNVAAAAFKMFTGDFAGAAASYNNAITSIGSGINSFINILEGPLKGIQASLGVIKAISGIKLPNFADIGEGLGGLADVAGAVAAEGGGGGKGAKNARKAAEELAKLMDSLYDLTVRWFGMRSELEKGLLGPEGFTASVDQIASMGKKLIEILRGLGATEVVKLVEASTKALMLLAQRREEVAERLKEAQQSLADAIRARDDFIRSVREQAISFANALNLETVTETRFRMVSDKGFFIQEEQQKQKSFVETLRERAKALKAFFENLRRLKAMGLDADLLEQLLVAGPEQAGEIAAGIAAGGKAMVNEVNGLQGNIEKMADDLGKWGGEAFYQSGVDQAQKLVDGLNAEQKNIEKQAKAISDVVYAAIKPWAKKMSDAGKAAGAAGAAGIATGIPKMGAAVGGMTTALTNSKNGTASWDNFMVRAGQDSNTVLGTWTDSWLGQIESFNLDAIAEMESWKDSIEGIFSGLQIKMPTFDIKAMAKSFFNGLSSMWNSIPMALKLLLFGGPLGVAAITGAIAAAKRKFGGGGKQPAGGSGSSYTPAASGSGGSGRAAPQTLAAPAALAMGVSAFGAETAAGVSALGAGAGAGYYGSATTTLYGANYVPGATTHMADLATQVSAPEVKVYIGDQELRGIVRTEVTQNGREQSYRIQRGRA